MHIHILGICGTFMGGIAQIARAAGHRVTGCDAGVYPPMSTQLEKAGIELHGTGRGGFTGVAFTDADGHYKARVAPSPLTAVIRAYRVVGKEKEPRFEGGPLEDDLEQYLPARYSDPGKSELRITPVAGKTTVADFALTSDKK